MTVSSRLTQERLAELLLQSNAEPLFVPGSENRGLPHKLTGREANALARWLLPHLGEQPSSAGSSAVPSLPVVSGPLDDAVIQALRAAEDELDSLYTHVPDLRPVGDSVLKRVRAALRSAPPRNEPDALLVERFAAAMAERLRYNGSVRGKSGWEDMSPRQLLRRAETELRELRRAVEKGADVLRVAHEAADVGNFCAMLATVYERAAQAPQEESR